MSEQSRQPGCKYFPFKNSLRAYQVINQDNAWYKIDFERFLATLTWMVEKDGIDPNDYNPWKLYCGEFYKAYQKKYIIHKALILVLHLEDQ